MKSKSKFMAGYNAGSRHEKLGITPPDFLLSDRSEDFRAGYPMGVLDRRAGILTDETAATGAIFKAWSMYEHAS